jgi:hypothetical protein
MAVVSYKRLNDSTISGRYGESFQIVEKWEIRTDSPTTTKVKIAGAVTGAYFGAAHPDISSCKAMEFDVAPADRSGLLWVLTVRYYVPPPGKARQESGMPADVWDAIGGTTNVPAFTDKDGVVITNSAKDPLEGLEREREERGWGLTKFYANDADWTAARDAYAGKVNSATWAGGAAKTWKCYFKGAKIREISKFEGDTDGGTLKFVETQWEFRYEPDTWSCKPWDVGFMELVSGQRKVILGSDGKPVKQPVALNSDGTKRTPGTAPSIINSGAGVELYGTANFSTGFGTPLIVT